MHGCIEMLVQTLLQHWEQDGCISVLLYLHSCVLLSCFSELAQPERITCLQALMSWCSQLPVVDKVPRTCVSKIPQLFSLAEYGKKSYGH